MTDRRRSYDQAGTGSPAYQRIIQRVDEGLSAVSDRMDAAFVRIESRIGNIERDMQRDNLDRDAVSRDVNELRRDVGELRDAISISGTKQADAAADGAVAAVTSAAPALTKGVWKTWWGKAVAAAVGFTALMVALNNVPDAIRGWDRTWAFLANRDAVAPTARQDKTDGK